MKPDSPACKSLIPALVVWSLPLFCWCLPEQLAAQSNTAQIKLPPGFQADLVYTISGDQGSWVSLATEKKGRLIASDQNGKLYRITPPKKFLSNADSSDSADGQDQAKIEPIEVELGFAQGLLYAFDSLYVVAHGNDKFKTPAGLFRVRDINGDDQYDDVQLLRQFEGGGEHGPHAVILSPDGKSLFVCAGNHTLPPKPEVLRMANRWNEDQLLTRYADANGHAAGIMSPGGWICKTDPDGKSFEMVSAGYRNQYDIAFDPNGELFTYDADMEWDIGLPWYRPTRVCHATSGSEFGWRHGSGKWPEYYPDNLPSVVDVGPGSPTGIVFGTGAKFPAVYQNALFISDWSYGIIYAVHLAPNGSTYRGTLERFCAAPALPVTDLVINPIDGAMYFLIGGRGLRSAMYRISYNGQESTEPASYPALTAAAEARRAIESMHQSETEFNDEQCKLAREAIRSVDRFIRFAGQVSLERQAPAAWLELLQQETLPQAILSGVVALARAGNQSHQAIATKLLGKLDWNQLTLPQRLDLCRAYGLIMIRLAGLGHDQQGRSGEAELLPETRAAVTALEQHFPSGNELLDRELGKLLVAIQSSTVTPKLVEQLKQAKTQEEAIAFAFMLADANQGWNKELRESYFQWFLDAARNQGGHSLSGYVSKLRQVVLERLSADDKADLAEILEKEAQTTDPYAELSARPLVKKWSLDDFKDLSEADFAKADIENGKKMFSVTACYRCHRIEGSGGFVGPDVTMAGHRFSTIDLLETIIDPNKAISDQYAATMFLMDDGQVVVGRVANLAGNNYMVQENLIMPGKFTNVQADKIEEMKPSQTSMMPSGLLDTLTKQEIVDLVTYMKATGASKDNANKTGE
jgi:putative heme-binding domain-containing protein